MRLAELIVMGPGDARSEWAFFRTELGKTLRVEVDGEGALRVDILKDGMWSRAPHGMIGLRLDNGAHNLTPAEITALPSPRVRVRNLEIGR